MHNTKKTPTSTNPENQTQLPPKFEQNTHKTINLAHLKLFLSKTPFDRTLSPLWAYRNSSKSTTGFSLFSLVYGTEVVSPAEIITSSLRLMQMQEKEKEEEVFMAERCEDLGGLDEKREKA